MIMITIGPEESLQSKIRLLLRVKVKLAGYLF